MRNHTVVLFKNKDTLSDNGFVINRRLVDLATDPASRLGDNPETLQELFERDYQDVYAYLQQVMFADDGAIIWTFASELERAGHMVYRTDIGIGIQVGHGKIEVASKVEAKSLDADTHRYVYLLPTQLRKMEADAKDHARTLQQAEALADRTRASVMAVSQQLEHAVVGRPHLYEKVVHETRY